MRIALDIDDELMRKALAATGLSKRATIERALTGLIESQERREALDALWGIGWSGNLDEMRDGRDFEPIPDP